MEHVHTTDIEYGKDYFAGRYDEAIQLDDQNQRYDTTLSDEMFDGEFEEFRQLTVDGLQQEQSRTLETLACRDNQSYEDIAAQYNQLTDDLADVHERLDTISDAEDVRKTRLLDVAHHAIELAPLSEESAMELARKRINQIENLNRKGLQHRVDTLSAELASVSGVFEIAGKPWPVPRIGREGEPELPPEDESNYVVADEMPIDPQMQNERQSENVLHRLVERYGHTNDASLMAAAHLIEREGEILTPLEVGKEVYKNSDHFDGLDEASVERIMRARTLTLLNVNTGRVNELLYNEGYTLQYGNRMIYDEYGRQKGPARRVYRTAKNNPNMPMDGTEFIDEVTYGGENSPVEEYSPEDDDYQSEQNATVEDIDKIEAEVSLKSRDEVWQSRVDELVKDVNTLTPWLLEKGVLPSEFDEKTSMKVLRTHLMRLKGTRQLKQAPVRIHDLGVFETSLAGQIKIDAVGAMKALMHSSYAPLEKDRSRTSELYDQFASAVKSIYEKDSGEDLEEQSN